MTASAIKQRRLFCSNVRLLGLCRLTFVQPGGSLSMSLESLVVRLLSHPHKRVMVTPYYSNISYNLIPFANAHTFANRRFLLGRVRLDVNVSSFFIPCLIASQIV